MRILQLSCGFMDLNMTKLKRPLALSGHWAEKRSFHVVKQKTSYEMTFEATNVMGAWESTSLS